ncbi:MAG: CDP-diacylglycerol--glycerol-3-phosphate 3-phosphatidyltransferase [Planctomycetes bacterium]|nr:CDP-diacylglycerol--glycerol-3-phosphate 3-phosphatidyltransferase [Planctomycetota bacterium]
MSETQTRRDLEIESAERRKNSLLTLPNQLTLARLLLSVVFFVIMAIVVHGDFSQAGRALVLNISNAIFITAVATDFLDGFLARRWGLVSTFGRIADPFVDKIVICGGFIMLIGVSDLVKPWFAVIILFREFLVSGLRSFLESRGIAFGAALSGKLKMLLQSMTIPAVLFHEANFSQKSYTCLNEIDFLAAAVFYVTVGLLALTVLATVGSCVGYIRRAARLLRG